jgi:hypothetical protein
MTACGGLLAVCFPGEIQLANQQAVLFPADP